MFSETKRRVFTPLMLVGFLCFGAVAAEAGEYRGPRDGGDRVAKGAVIGAVVGTLLQLAQGRNEGREILAGAVVGGTLGAVAGSFDHGRRDRYYRADEGYAYGYEQGDACSTVEPYQGGYAYRSGYEGYRDRDAYRDRRWSERYDRDDRYAPQFAPRYDRRYPHH